MFSNTKLAVIFSARYFVVSTRALAGSYTAFQPTRLIGGCHGRPHIGANGVS